MLVSVAASVDRSDGSSEHARACRRVDGGALDAGCGGGDDASAGVGCGFGVGVCGDWPLHAHKDTMHTPMANTLRFMLALDRGSLD
jgi:hypothetical protein